MAIFGGKKFLLAFLNNSELRLASYEISGSAVSRKDYETLEFKSSVVKDSAILDAQAFQSEIASFFSQKKELAGSPVLLVIPEEKVFLKGFELGIGDLGKKEAIRREFISEIPFDESDLIIQERLAGKVVEFSAVDRRFIGDFQAPFLNQKMPILGMAAIPQIMALDLQPKEKSFLLAFYDNDFALALAENSCVIFSETRRLKDGNIREAMRAFDHFVQHLQATDNKSISLILGEEAIEDAVKLELEHREYSIKEVKKANILDMIADYYNSHRNKADDWNLLRVRQSPMMDIWNRYKRPVLKLFIASLVLIFAGTAGWLAYGRFWQIPAGFEIIPEELPAESEIPAAEQNQPPQPLAEEKPSVSAPAEKSDFPIQIFNGTTIAGEAGRLKTVLEDRGFTVSGIGNNDDQNQAVTTLFVDSSAPEAIISDLRLILEARYANVLVSPSPVMAKVIHIVIGKKK